MNKQYFLGDSVTLQFTAKTDITNWQLRAEFYDNKCTSIKLANTASGGDDTQIEITDALNGVFLVKIAKNLTTNFDLNSFLEIEREDSSGDLKTIWSKPFKFTKQQIDWTAP